MEYHSKEIWIKFATDKNANSSITNTMHQEINSHHSMTAQSYLFQECTEISILDLMFCSMDINILKQPKLSTFQWPIHQVLSNNNDLPSPPTKTPIEIFL